MADSEKNVSSDKKVKTEESAAETIVGDASAEIKDSTESGVDVSETVNIPEEQVFKTLVTKGVKGGIYVFCVPVSNEAL